MKRIVIAVFTVLMALSPMTEAKQPAPIPYTQGEPNEADLASHAHYKNKDGEDVHSPSKSKSGKVPQGASAQCRDGSYSFSTHHRGTCSHHGGVAHWLQ